MCGIVTLIGTTEPVNETVAFAMTRIIEHRGPDGEGVVLFGYEGDRLYADRRERPVVAMGNRRLAILDVSEAAAQPMSYRNRWWVTYNGELYNYVELRDELRSLGHEFRSAGDTEVVLASFAQWGLDCFARFRGMWGLAVLDLEERTLTVSRDRLGIKPIYLWRDPLCEYVLSEPKQLRAIPGVRLRADRTTLGRYLLQGYEESDATMFTGLRQLPAGTTQTYDLVTRTWTDPRSYWTPRRPTVLITDPDEAGAAFRSTFERSVSEHLRSDVPLGFALSGGLDSSVLALTASGASKDLRTYSVVFPGKSIDESFYASAVAARLKGPHRTVTPTVETFLEDLDAFTWHHDEPVGSLSQYAGYVLAREMRSDGVPVALNGQGGDELFSAYWQSYMVSLRTLVAAGRWREAARQLAGAAGPRGNRQLLRQLLPMLKRYAARRAPRWMELVPGTDPPDTLRALRELDDHEWRTYEIRRLWLPRLLKWDDRNFMAHSVEGRYPFLDHDLIELSLSFAPSARYWRGWTKEPLRRAFADLLPHQIARRRTKFGFETPQHEWALNVLRPQLSGLPRADSPLWDAVDREAARALLDYTFESERPEATEAAMRLYFALRWADAFEIDSIG